MTHEFFHGGEVNAREDKAGGKRVAKVVEPAVWDSCPSDRSVERGLDSLDR